MKTLSIEEVRAVFSRPDARPRKKRIYPKLFKKGRTPNQRKVDPIFETRIGNRPPRTLTAESMLSLLESCGNLLMAGKLEGDHEIWAKIDAICEAIKRWERYEA